MSEWIKVSERLPDDGDDVLVVVNRKYPLGDGEEITFGVYYKNNKYINGWHALICGQAGCFNEKSEDVTHWMPLPAPPEAE